MDGVGDDDAIPAFAVHAQSTSLPLELEEESIRAGSPLEPFAKVSQYSFLHETKCELNNANATRSRQ